MTGAERTASALGRWCAALPAETYDVRSVEAGCDRALLRHFSAAQLMGSVAWLRRMNAQGWHVYARPCAHRHVLVDDLDADGLDTLRAGHRIAAVVETSPHNHQAWVTVSATEVAPAGAAAVARRLAAQFGGDGGATGRGQVGRLPGFTNRKPIHERGGLHPFALLRCAGAVVDPAGAALVRAAASEVEAEAAPAQMGPGATPRVRCRAPEVEAAEALAWVRASLPPGVAVDRSRVDHAMAVRLLRRGADAACVGAALLAGERATSMPVREAERYAARTLAAASKALRPQV